MKDILFDSKSNLEHSESFFFLVTYRKTPTQKCKKKNCTSANFSLSFPLFLCNRSSKSYIISANVITVFFFPRNRRKEDHKSTGPVLQYCHRRRVFLTVRRPFGRCGNLATGSRCDRRLPNATLLTTSMLISVLRPDIDNIQAADSHLLTRATPRALIYLFFFGRVLNFPISFTRRHYTAGR